MAMRIMQSFQCLPKPTAAKFNRWSLQFEPARQVAAFHVFDRDPAKHTAAATGHRARGVDLHNMWTTEASQHDGFLREAIERLIVRSAFVARVFAGHCAFEAKLLDKNHPPRPADGQLALE